MRIARIECRGRVVTAVVDGEGRYFGLDRDFDYLGADRTEFEASAEATGAAIARGDRQADVPDRWLPPIRAGKVIGVAMNNSAFAPMSYAYFKHPAFFMKAPSTLIGHGEPVILRPDYGLTHPEPELACVIGRRASNLVKAHALDCIFGFTIINDVTSVGLKDEDSLHLEFEKEPLGFTPVAWRRTRPEADFDIYLTYHFRSKCTDTFGPIGPWITTKDDVPDPDNLTIDAWLGDRLIAQDSTANLSFSIADVLVHLTRYSTLEPGDVVHFGTAIDPKRFALREANILADPWEMRIKISGLGELANPVKIDVRS